MTVLVGLVHHDGIAVLADRASVDPYRQIADGVPAPGAPTVKVFAAPASGVVAGIAGIAVVPGVDLLALVRRVVAESTSAGAAHGSLMHELAGAAPMLREHQAVATQVNSFQQPVMTVVLLGGHGGPGGDAQLVAYGLPDSGPPVFQSLQRSAVFAPASVQPEAEAMAFADDPSTPVAQQVQLWGSRLDQLAPVAIARQHVDISAEWDAALVASTGSVEVINRQPRRTRIQVPRH